jgi:hypothetical protein
LEKFNEESRVVARQASFNFSSLTALVTIGIGGGKEKSYNVQAFMDYRQGTFEVITWLFAFRSPS